MATNGSIPFGGGFAGGLLRNPSPASIRGAQGILGEAGQAGLFSPMGSPRLRALRRRRAMQLNEARRRAASSAGQLFGLDPMSQRAALIQGDVAGNRDPVSGLLGADFEEEQGQRQFLQNLYGQQLGYEQQRQLQKQAEKAAKSGGIGGAFGSLLGGALGFIPGASTLFGGGGSWTGGRGSSWD